MLIILTGKTASGKDTIKQKLLQKYPDFKKVITTTSRTPRNGETSEVDYHFLTRDEFQNKINAGEFAEYVEYGGNLYGTYKSELEKALNSNCIWRIDPSRAGEAREFIKRAFPTDLAQKLIQNTKVLYITVPDEVVLERLKRRSLSDEEIQKRMADDKKIWEENQNNYDYVVENVPGKLDESIDKIISILSL